jgi:DnaJ-class molecular chaperone
VAERVKSELSIGREIELPRDCFADEVAIDFPSIGGIVERARESFLGNAADDDVDTHATDLALSFREAWRGAVVPIELPLRGTCSTCGGRGEIWTEPCAECCGTGDSLVRHAVHVAVPPGVSHGSRLRFRLRSPHVAPLKVEVRVLLTPRR